MARDTDLDRIRVATPTPSPVFVALLRALVRSRQFAGLEPHSSHSLKEVNRGIWQKASWQGSLAPERSLKHSQDPSVYHRRARKTGSAGSGQRGREAGGPG